MQSNNCEKTTAEDTSSCKSTKVDVSKTTNDLVKESGFMKLFMQRITKAVKNMWEKLCLQRKWNHCFNRTILKRVSFTLLLLQST